MIRFVVFILVLFTLCCYETTAQFQCAPTCVTCSLGICMDSILNPFDEIPCNPPCQDPFSECSFGVCLLSPSSSCLIPCVEGQKCSYGICIGDPCKFQCNTTTEVCTLNPQLQYYCKSKICTSACPSGTLCKMGECLPCPTCSLTTNAAYYEEMTDIFSLTDFTDLISYTDPFVPLPPIIGTLVEIDPNISEMAEIFFGDMFSDASLAAGLSIFSDIVVNLLEVFVDDATVVISPGGILFSVTDVIVLPGGSMTISVGIDSIINLKHMNLSSSTLTFSGDGSVVLPDGENMSFSMDSSLIASGAIALEGDAGLGTLRINNDGVRVASNTEFSIAGPLIGGSDFMIDGKLNILGKGSDVSLVVGLNGTVVLGPGIFNGADLSLGGVMRVESIGLNTTFVKFRGCAESATIEYYVDDAMDLMGSLGFPVFIFDSFLPKDALCHTFKIIDSKGYSQTLDILPFISEGGVPARRLLSSTQPANSDGCSFTNSSLTCFIGTENIVSSSSTTTYNFSILFLFAFIASLVR